MSIRTNPMKAVPTLLKRLGTVQKQANLEDLKSELNKIKDLFSIVKNNEDELLEILTIVDNYIRKSNIHKLVEEKENICQRIRNSTQKLLPEVATQSSNKEVVQSAEKTFQDVKLDKREEVNKELSPEMFKVHYNDLDRLHKRFFLSLLLLPKNAIIKKSTIHFWWASVVGYFMIGQFEFVFDYLFSHKLILPHGNGKCPVVSKFKINPCVHHESVQRLLRNDEEQLCGIYSQLITSSHRPNTSHRSLVLDQKKVKLDEFHFKSSHWTAIFNVSASYLNFGPQWMTKMKHLEVLQLGRWLHDSPSHHIEVDSEEFMKELKNQKNLKYLSLRGISRIFELPPSIFQLESLAILDLKACHNLETLPNDIASLKNLRHLDLSQCYLLERMPKGIEKLTNLEVLKGFVIGSSSKTPYKLPDLANLKNLERLSIHIGRGAVIKDREFESLKKLSKLENLKISWGVFDKMYSDIKIILPSSLKKLHLEGFPGQNIPELLMPSDQPQGLKPSDQLQGLKPSDQLQGLKPSDQLQELKPSDLKVLNITGGKLRSINPGENNSHRHVEIMHLKYIQYLNVDPTNLQELFPSLRYAEIKRVRNHQYFEWLRNEER